VYRDARTDGVSLHEKGLTGEREGIDWYPKARFPQANEIEARFASRKRAFALVKRVTGTDGWDAITRR